MNEQNRIKYLCYYALPDDEQERSHILAADNFIDYVSDAMIEAGKDVLILSASPTDSKTKGCKGFTKELKPHKRIRFFRAFPWNNIINKALTILIIRAHILYELLSVSKGEVVMVYHSLAYMRTVEIARRLKKFTLLLYVGEIYSDVTHDEKMKQREMRFFQCADRYVFATEFLDRIINKNNKPSLALYGSYHNEPVREDVARNDGKIHCVYAGTFDHMKGEAQQSVEMSQYLTDDYCVHICGFGNERDTKDLLEKVNQINTQHPGRILYEGSLRGEAFIRMLQSCQIGLFTPISHLEFNGSDFPSKILSYLTNGQQVVSARVDPVEKSPLGPYLTFYDGDRPEDIAKAVQAVDIRSSYNGRAIVDLLRNDFMNNFKNLLQK